MIRIRIKECRIKDFANFDDPRQKSLENKLEEIKVLDEIFEIIKCILYL